MDLVSRSYKVLGYDGPVPEGFTLSGIDTSEGYLRVLFEKTVLIPNSTATEHTYLSHYLNAFGTVVVKSTEVYQRNAS